MKHIRADIPPEWKGRSKKAEKDDDDRLYFMKNLEKAKEFTWIDTPIEERCEVLHILVRRLLLKEAER